MNNQRDLIIQSGLVLENKQIAAHTFHLKIQSDDFAKMQYVAGFTVDIFLGNPFYDTHCEDRKYSFWNYEPRSEFDSVLTLISYRVFRPFISFDQDVLS